MNKDNDCQDDSSNFVILSLGANIGDSRKTINKAIELLSSSGSLMEIKIASFYQTEPVGYKDQDWFINTVVSGFTDMSLFSLIAFCKSIEYSLGRKPRDRWHEREIDIDVLVFGSQVVDYKQVTVPHPRMHERRFVLEPAAEIAGSFVHPRYGRTIDQLLQDCRDDSVVIRER